MKQIIKATVCLLGILSILFSCKDSNSESDGSNTPPETPSSENYVELKVSMDEVITEDFLGVNAVYHGFAYMPEQEKKGMDDEDREREFSRVKNMDLHIARTMYTQAFTFGDYNIYKEIKWDDPHMIALCKWIQKMKDLGVDIAFQSGWNFPTWNVENPNDLERFVEWVDKSLCYLINEREFTNIKYVHLFTEGINGAVWNDVPVPSGYSSWLEYYSFVCHKIHDKLVESGIRDKIKLVGPNYSTNDPNFPYDVIGYAVSNMNDIIDIYSWHYYGHKDGHSSTYEGWMDMVKEYSAKIARTGKPFWIDEFGIINMFEKERSTPFYGLYLSKAVAGMINAGAQTMLLWILFDQQYVQELENYTSDDAFHNGVHRWGTCKWPHDDIENPTEPYPSWYAYSLMSKYLGGEPGTQVLKTVSSENSKLYIVGVKHPSGDLSLMVVNDSSDEQEFKIRFNQKLSPKTFNKHEYNPAKLNVTEDAVIPPVVLTKENVEDSFVDNITPYSMAIYTTMKN